MSSDVIYTVIGGAGACLILFGFYRTSIGRWTNKSLWYELDNLIGPLMLIAYSLHFKAYVSVVINTVWMIVAFRGLVPFAERYSSRLRKQAKRARRNKRRRT